MSDKADQPPQPNHPEVDTNGSPGAPKIMQAPANGIVVGHDGSAHSERALAVALELAGQFRVALTIVRAWSIDTAPHGSVFDNGYVASLSEISATVRERLERDAQRVVSRQRAVVPNYRAVLGEPADVLVKISALSRILVVGTRGHGGLMSLMLGSVSEHCVHHALCPVLVVPGDERRSATSTPHD
jgi:nucleotide-binding universal stress UspA family protein